MILKILICFNFGFLVISTFAAIYWGRRLVMYIFRKMLEDFNWAELMGEPENADGVIDHPQDKAGAGCALYRDCVAEAISGGNAKNLLGRAII